MPLRRAVRLLVLPPAVGLGLFLACGGGGGNTGTTGTVTQAVAVSVNPSSATLSVGASQTFTASVTGSSNTAVSWTCSAGSITGAGVFTAPATAGTVTITATSVADPSKSATATVTVQAAQAVAVSVNPATATLTTGATQAFAASVTGTSNTGVTWTCSAGSITGAGVFTAPATAGTVTITATSVADPSKSARATVTVQVAQVVAVTVNPISATLNAGAVQTFTATVTGTSNTGVTWTCSAGRISASGVFTAPASAGTVTITATSVADPSKSATATVTVQAAQVVAVSVNPATATLATGATQAFTATVTGTSNTGVTWTTSAGSITGAGVFTAPSTAGTVTITATSVADPSKSAKATVTVQAAQVVAVSVNPTSATLVTGATQAFTASVTGSSNTAVTWTCSAGSITSSGLFTAPSTAGTVTITATSVADPSKSASATITVQAAQAVAVSVNPASATLNAGATQAFTASVTGSSNTAVTWTCSAGSITSSGLFTAPAGAGTVTITATSVADPSKTATAAVTVKAVASTLTVGLNPSAVTLNTGAVQTFTAAVTGSSNTGVTWTASAGSITPAGVFTAPTSAGTVTVTATSQADASKSASATVTVTAPVSTGGLTLGQVTNQAGRYYVGYYPSWSDNWFTAFTDAGAVKSDDDIYRASNLAKIPGVYTHVMVAFAQPDFAWKGLAANSWEGTGINFNGRPTDIKEAIRVLHLLNKKIVLSVGGATYGNWSTLASEAGKPGPTKAALTQFLVDMDFDGLDVDYEIGDTTDAGVTQYAQAIQAMREAVDAAGSQRILGVAGWSTGADYIAATPKDATWQNLYKVDSFWGGLAGRERLTFNRSVTSGPRAGQAVGSLFDLVTVMSYDAQTLHYDPVTAFDEYRDLVPATTPVCMGLEIAPEGWAGGLLVVRESDASPSVAGTWVVEDQYGRKPRGSYSVERFGAHVLGNASKANAHDGFMLWTILKTHSVAAGAAQTANANTVSDYVTGLFNYVPTPPTVGTGTGTVTVSPRSARVATGSTLACTAQVQGGSGVTWTTTGGTITSDGRYTAPATPGTYTVTATSQADATRTASLTVSVVSSQPEVSVGIAPASVSVQTGASQAFTASVTGSSNPGVNWSCTGGTITADGLFTAGSTAGSYTVTATSQADPTRKAVAMVTVTTPGGGGTTTAGFSVTFTRTSSWAGGYNGEITLTNTGSQPVSTWTLSFTLTDAMSSSWNANQVVNGQNITFTPLSWNANLAPGANVVIGYGASTTASGGWAPPATATVNGQTVNVTTRIGGGSGNTTTPTLGLTGYDQTGSPAMSLLVTQGTTRVPLTASGVSSPVFKVENNHTGLLQATVEGSTLVLTSKATQGGRAGLRITETSTGVVRHVGVRLKDAAGKNPGFPGYVSMGVVSEDSDADLGMFHDFGTGDLNRRVDNRYVYLNGGPVNGWWTWSNVPGDRARLFIRNSLKIGAIPTFVWYNIPDGGESYTTDLEHIQDPAYMKAYFQLLSDTLKIFNEEAPDETIMMVMEPDFIGYMMQLSGKTPDQIQAYASAVKAAGLWKAGDPDFPDTLPGLVDTINYLIARDAPQVRFGWQLNVWASLDGTPNAPVAPKSLMKVTDTDQMGWTRGRQVIHDNAVRIGAYYKAAHIANGKAHFISFDKYGLDAVGVNGAAAADPAGSQWFWNADHWNNYLYFVKTLHEETGLPVALWQLPVGRINSSKAPNPYVPGGLFPDLNNTTNRYEDSTASFFFGDTFVAGSDVRSTYFAANASADPSVSRIGDNLTWGAHVQAARDAGVFNMMFGDGVGMSTKARPLQVGATAPDGWWLMTAIQRYYVAPVAVSAP